MAALRSFECSTAVGKGSGLFAGERSWRKSNRKLQTSRLCAKLETEDREAQTNSSSTKDRRKEELEFLIAGSTRMRAAEVSFCFHNLRLGRRVEETLICPRQRRRERTSAAFVELSVRSWKKPMKTCGKRWRNRKPLTGTIWRLRWRFIFFGRTLSGSGSQSPSIGRRA